jgi:FkbM family methyltransferase
MFSQHDEEQVIIDFFGGRIGRFLDIGAMDGKTNSNTLRLSELGWGGVLVEPSPNPLAALIALHRHNPKIEIVNACIAAESKLVTWYDSHGDGISTTVPEHAEHWHKTWGTNYAKILIKTTTVRELLTAVGIDFDFISLDVESANLELLNLLPLANMPAKLVCVEHDRHQTEMTALLAPLGFSLIHETGENCIFARSK